MSKTSNFLKELVSDFKSILMKPHESFSKIIKSGEIKYSRPLLVFVVIMHTYYVFVPSYLMLMNVLAIIFFFMLIGMMYYFMQEAMLVYREEYTDYQEDDRFLYTIAYCFSLANLPAMILSIVANFLAIFLSDDLLLGIFWALLSMIPIFFVAIFYPLKLMKAISKRDKGNIRLLIELSIKSFITTIKGWLGYNAVKDILIDWKESA